jgi:hypothetical protein
MAKTRFIALAYGSSNPVPSIVRYGADARAALANALGKPAEKILMRCR